MFDFYIRPVKKEGPFVAAKVYKFNNVTIKKVLNFQMNIVGGGKLLIDSKLNKEEVIVESLVRLNEVSGGYLPLF